jgi:POT family proton-dependent oligopeptide transporter
MQEEGAKNREVKKSLGRLVGDSFKQIGDTLAAFARAPRALWGVNIPYVMEGLVYFGILTILGKFCSENVGLSDPQSGWVYGAVTGGITFAMLLFGGVTDRLGVRVSLALALAVMAVGRGLVALSGTIPLGRGMGSPMFFVMALGLLMAVIAWGFYMPAAYAGVKRYTNPKTAAVGYAVVYALLNLGAFLSGIVSPNVRHLFEKVMPPNGLPAVFWVYAGLNLVGAVLTLVIIRRRVDRRAVEQVAKEAAEMKDTAAPEAKKEEAKEQKKKLSLLDNALFIALVILALGVLSRIIFIKAEKAAVPVWTYGLLFVCGAAALWEFLRKRPDHPFRDLRFVVFIFSLIPVQTLFAHNWLTIPYYLDRAFTGTTVSRYFEFFSNLNPLIIFVITPLIAAMTARANVYRMMIIGTFVMATPTFLLALGPNLVLFVVYVISMSVGEAMWQPRFLQWVAEIAPEGKTGMYIGIGQLPWFLTKLITASYSGFFVARYIPKPETGLAVNSGAMWLIYACIAMVTPVILLLAKGWIGKGVAGRAAEKA